MSFYFILTMYKTIHKMPRRKCSTCKKNKKNRPLRRKHNKSHKKHLNVMRGGMESRKRPRTPEWWDLAVEGTHLDDRQYINNDAIFVSFTADIDVEAQNRFIENNELLRPSMFVTRHMFGRHEPASVIVATNTYRVYPKTFTILCKNAILHMFPFDMYSFGHKGPPRINLFIQYHDEPIIHHVVPIREY